MLKLPKITMSNLLMRIHFPTLVCTNLKLYSLTLMHQKRPERTVYVLESGPFRNFPILFPETKIQGPNALGIMQLYKGGVHVNSSTSVWKLLYVPSNHFLLLLFLIHYQALFIYVTLVSLHTSFNPEFHFFLVFLRNNNTLVKLNHLNETPLIRLIFASFSLASWKAFPC
jgi:hypothetical protein